MRIERSVTVESTSPRPAAGLSSYFGQYKGGRAVREVSDRSQGRQCSGSVWSGEDIVFLRSKFRISQIRVLSSLFNFKDLC
jgi:hypothetical protein